MVTLKKLQGGAMSDKPNAPIGLMIRLPADLHEQVRQVASGSSARPKASLNETVIFLLRAGLAALKKAERAENEPGEWMPESLELVEA